MVDTASLQTETAIRQLMGRVGAESVKDLLALRCAALLARGGNGVDLSLLETLQARIAQLRQKALPLPVTDLALTGTDVMRLLKIGPGPRVGEVLARLLEVVIEEPKKNNPAELTKVVLKMGEG